MEEEFPYALVKKDRVVALFKDEGLCDQVAQNMNFAELLSLEKPNSHFLESLMSILEYYKTRAQAIDEEGLYSVAPYESSGPELAN
jgi:hypothetical protein